MNILFVNPNRDTWGFKPISLSILSALAKRQGWNTSLFDTTLMDVGDTGFNSREVYETSKLFKPVDYSGYNIKKEQVNITEKLGEVIEDKHPDLIAFTVMSDQCWFSDELTKYIKRTFTDIPILWGGVYATLNPERSLKKHGADYVCVGEGIEAVPELLQGIKECGNLNHIRNIWTPHYKNPIRPLKENLDDLPYLDWDIFDKVQFLKPYNGKVVIGGDHMITWGCPNHCTYCINHYYHQLYPRYPIRGYSTGRIITELKYLTHKYGIEFYKFNDEDFLLKPLEKLRELSNLYKKEVNIPFAMMCNAKSATREKVELLKEMNCVSISFGLECGDFLLRKTLLNRIDTKEDILNCVSLFNKANIRTSSFNMLGLPFYSRDVYQKTIELNREANIQYPNASFFYPYEGTKLLDISIDNGFFNADERSVYKEGIPNLHFPDLTKEELLEMHRCFTLYIKLPKEYETFIRRSEVKDSIGLNLIKKLNEIYDITVLANDGWYKDDGNRNQYLLELRGLMK